MKVDLFDFNLPPELIAQKPASPRDSAKLLHVTANGLTGQTIRDLPDLLRPGDLLVVNDTRVIPARLTGKRGDAANPGRPEGGAKIEVTLHKWAADGTWRAFAKPARKLNARDYIVFAPGFAADVIQKLDMGEFVLRFNKSGPDLKDALEQHGVMPLPPYIKREDAGDDADRSDYQSLFAQRDGAVAAPTASLHFTKPLINALDGRGVERVSLTLHVGAGTFLPVREEDTRHHTMHAEWGEITEQTADFINKVKRAGGRIVACGSTSMRLLEAAADKDGTIKPFRGETDIFIAPGYRFKACDMMLTNFHLPRSTLFMLVAAFAGLDRMRDAYAHAMRSGYRFYSYGDACLLERANGDSAG
ncbi:MAG: tRNA preQ1(34) S-adenosylmethionine ribosyltransferase-isomerase QueA [Rhodospirillaceae bacterium]